MPSDTTPLRAHLREHILCVDDEEGILAALRQQLSARFGAECDIAVAKNAREALDLMEDLQQDGDYVSVLFKHQGWKEPVEFMHHCSTKWAIYLMSLKSLLETGKGAPNPNDIRIHIKD